MWVGWWARAGRGFHHGMQANMRLPRRAARGKRGYIVGTGTLPVPLTVLPYTDELFLALDG